MGKAKLDVDKIERDVERLVLAAVEAATTAEELLDVALAAAAIDRRPLLEAVGVKVADQVAKALASSSAWEAELTYSKIDAWAQTGHRARLLAEAWGAVSPGLRR